MKVDLALVKKEPRKPSNEDWHLSLGMHLFRAAERETALGVVRPCMQHRGCACAGSSGVKTNIVKLKSQGRRVSGKHNLTHMRQLPLARPGRRAARRRGGERDLRHGDLRKSPVKARRLEERTSRQARRARWFDKTIVARFPRDHRPKRWNQWSKSRRRSWVRGYFVKHRKAAPLLLYARGFKRFVEKEGGARRWGWVVKVVRRHQTRRMRRAKGVPRKPPSFRVKRKLGTQITIDEPIVKDLVASGENGPKGLLPYESEFKRWSRDHESRFNPEYKTPGQEMVDRWEREKREAHARFLANDPVYQRQLVLEQAAQMFRDLSRELDPNIPKVKIHTPEKVPITNDLNETRDGPRAPSVLATTTEDIPLPATPKPRTKLLSCMGHTYSLKDSRLDKYYDKETGHPLRSSNLPDWSYGTSVWRASDHQSARSLGLSPLKLSPQYWKSGQCYYEVDQSKLRQRLPPYSASRVNYDIVGVREIDLFPNFFAGYCLCNADSCPDKVVSSFEERLL